MALAVAIGVVLLLGFVLLHLATPPPHCHRWIRKADKPPLRFECACGAVKMSEIQPPWEYFSANKVYLCPQCGDLKPRSWSSCSACRELQGARR